MVNNDWRDYAACRDEDPELFFPVSELGPGARQTAEAKSVCARCPVRAECLDYAIDEGLDFGIFGGTTERERRELLRRRRVSRSRSRGEAA
ncbi:transcription factor WhiB [Prauserella shujinwangii]|uniref:Transcriptional regulator WhiB n=1 Tax=Prauserella shujinwangii TaxID=1453103 RepID=A0A2T0LR15_9PSEU|nr:WhiB family transcriptional regulator [Prauserella shujinwangii]PRX45914.1 transcription factor WhiB [Prauserella shujinwangii]